MSLRLLSGGLSAELEHETREVGKTRFLIMCIIALVAALGSDSVSAQRNEMPAGYPQSLEADLQALLGKVREGAPSPGLLVRLSETYFDLADDLLTGEAKRRQAYEAGAKAAKQAYELDESNADAHFFHAVNLGSAERLRGATNAALAVREMKRCAEQTIELNPKHAQGLQMLGGMLMELPWMLGGSETKAQEYLERAVAADGNYTKARIFLAKLYKKQGRLDEAKRHLEAVIHAEHPHYAYTWAREYKPEAERLLNEWAKSSPVTR